MIFIRLICRKRLKLYLIIQAQSLKNTQYWLQFSNAWESSGIKAQTVLNILIYDQYFTYKPS